MIMKNLFLAINLLYGIPGLLLALVALSGVTQNPVAALIGLTLCGLAAVCLWLSKECLSATPAGPPTAA
jgi:hypothetical protein